MENSKKKKKEVSRVDKVKIEERKKKVKCGDLYLFILLLFKWSCFKDLG